MNALQNTLSRAAKYHAAEMANRVKKRFCHFGHLHSVNAYPPVVSACAQMGGEIYVSETKHIHRKHVHQTLRDELENRLGYRIGERTPYANNSYVGYCAEPNAVNDLLRHERLNDFDEIYFGDAYRPRTGVVIPPCGNCQRTFNNVIVR